MGTKICLDSPNSLRTFYYCSADWSIGSCQLWQAPLIVKQLVKAHFPPRHPSIQCTALLSGRPAACLHKSRIQLAWKHDFSSFNLGRIIRLMTQINDSAEFSNPTLVKNDNRSLSGKSWSRQIRLQGDTLRMTSAKCLEFVTSSPQFSKLLPSRLLSILRIYVFGYPYVMSYK